MSIKKILALVVMFAALVAVFAGISYVNNYTSQLTRQTPVSTDSVVVPPNGYGHFLLQQNSSQENYYFSMSISNGTLREDAVAEEIYQAWLNGSYKPSWREVPSPGWSQGGDDYWPLSAVSQERLYYIFWNPDSTISKEVTFKICEQWTEPVYNTFNLGFGIFLIAAGAVSGLAAAFSVSKRTLIVVIALTLIVSGIFLVTTNSQTFHHEEITATNSLAVPAGSCVNESVRYNATGFHYFMLKVDNGTMNSTVLSVEDFATFSQGQYEPYWQNWRGSQGISGTMDGGSANHVYLVLSNPEAFDKQVTVQVYRAWDEYNYFGLIGGILLIAVGVIAFYFANKSQVASFNKALENQE
jgi:hypothetical protein